MSSVDPAEVPPFPLAKEGCYFPAKYLRDHRGDLAKFADRLIALGDHIPLDLTRTVLQMIAKTEQVVTDHEQHQDCGCYHTLEEAMRWPDVWNEMVKKLFKDGTAS